MTSLLLCLNLCYGFARPLNWYFCPDVYQILARISQHSHTHTQCIIVNDCHTSDDSEFKFLPPHMDSGIMQAPIADYDKYIRVPYEVSKKNSLSAVLSEHNRKLITNRFDKIDLCGFNVSTDILPTAISLVDQKQNFSVIADCCGDIDRSLAQKGLEYIKTLGINVK